MTVTPDHARMLATIAAACRPSGARRWDHAGIMAALKQVADRSLAEVTMATIRAAADRDAETPGVIPSAGSHWAESASVRTSAPDNAPTEERCTICGRTLHGVTDHEYRRPHEKLDAETVAARVAAIKAELSPTAGPTDRRTLQDMAAANPELHARVEAVRAANPGLTAPSMTEPEPTTTESEREA